MEVTIGAKCWDGARRKSLSEVWEGGVNKVESRPIAIDHRARSFLSYTVPLAFLASGISRTAEAATPDQAIPVSGLADGMKSTILHAFDPLIDLIQSLSYPIAGLMIAGGCLFIMVGSRERGMSMLQNAAIGYILVQLTPLLLKLLVGIGNAV